MTNDVRFMFPNQEKLFMAFFHRRDQAPGPHDLHCRKDRRADRTAFIPGSIFSHSLRAKTRIARLHPLRAELA